MKAPLDSDLARLSRWVVLPLAMIAWIVGLLLMPLMPGPTKPDLGEYVFRLMPVVAAIVLTFVAAWLRKQEALDPAYDGSISKSLLRLFALYSACALIACLALAVFLYR